MLARAVAERQLEPKRLEMSWRGKQTEALLDQTRELNIEGALRASKTTICLWREFNAYISEPGIHGLLARWTDSGVYGLLVPLWRAICAATGTRLKWNPDEEYDELPNGSRAYIRGLKSQDQTLRYSKFRGLTLARAYIDQAEELPHDVYLELAARLSQKGYRHQITISPQAVDENHWIAHEFPPNNAKPERKYISLSVHDNAHNLDDSVIPALIRLYPPEHPKHKALVLGLRGMNVIGEPVYKGAFVRSLHEKPLAYDPKLPLEMALDFGKHHPCVVFRQVSSLGQIRFLGGILGQSLYLDDFLEIVLRYRSLWFPNPSELLECCDPAGAADTSHGTAGAVKTLRAKGLYPRYVADSNSPAVRLAMIERLASHMRRRAADRSEALQVNAARDRWLRVSEQATVEDTFLADGFEAGYVWDEHLVSVNNKQVRKPKKDGWYEHGMNCAEYLEANFGAEPKKLKPEPKDEAAAYAGPQGWMS